LKKRFGQHFISDPRLLQRIVRFSGVTAEDTVIEIGPGAGALTRALAQTVKQVIAIEIDRDLIPALRSGMPANVEVVEGDALELDFSRLAPGEFHVLGNLPYNIGTPLLKRCIAQREHIRSVTVMLQREVAERLRAKPGTSDYGPLSVLGQYYARLVWGFVVPPGAFTPRPKVDSAVIQLTWRAGVPTDEPFTDFVHRAFGSRRKKLVNNLASMNLALTREQLEALLHSEGIPKDSRPENLSVDQFLRIYRRMSRSV
jgi:16S rRNA (adenine1518-N6/adenine1519-N6)-dimethyltransferase